MNPSQLEALAGTGLLLFSAFKRGGVGVLAFLGAAALIVHATIGRASFTPDQLKTNFVALIDALNKAKPSGVKGIYMKKVSVSSTMGAGVRVDQTSFGQQVH
jgi:large subunit ribosomal protein L1